MYSEEIKKYIELRNHILQPKEYVNIIQSSPQIDHITFKDNEFNLYTNDNYKFKVRVKKE